MVAPALLLWLCSILATVTSPAAATATDRALAQTLFDDGRSLLREGRLELACPKLAESQRLDPTSGTLINLALCHEMEGKTATAWTEYKEAAALAHKEGSTQKQRIASESIQALEPRLSRLRVSVAGGGVAGLVVRVNGVRLGPASWQVASPVDGGEHVVQASAPGKRSWTQRVQVEGDGRLFEVEIPELIDVSRPAAPTRRPVASIPSPPVGEATSAQATTGTWIAGSGVVAMLAGGYFGLRAKAKWDERQEHCPGNFCDAVAVEAGDQAQQYAWASNVIFGVGISGLLVGGYLILSAPSTPAPRQALSVSPELGQSKAGLSLGGTF
jgi:hypothetical protein